MTQDMWQEQRLLYISMLFTYLFKIERTLRFAYKIKKNFCIHLPFGGHHMCPMHGVPCKFGKDILNIKDVVLIFQNEPFLRREPIKSQYSALLYYLHHTVLCFGEIHM